MNLSNIEYHKVRDVWKLESADFSNWLAKSTSLELLSNTIGIPLSFIKREASKNSRLRVDILAKNSINGDLIIIENQLEETDYSHLGKLITYASLFNSNTIIWIVSNIRKEHELAINWLNNNSKEPINLFLVRVDVVSIDKSKLAPIFTVISKPINHNLPKIKIELDKETKELLDEKTELTETVLDKRIIAFFNENLKLNYRYTKYPTEDNKTISILGMLKQYDELLYAKYSISNTRDLKSDMFKWASFCGYQINQRTFERTGKRDYKSGGKEFFLIEEL